MSPLKALFAGFALAWVVVWGYIWIVGRRASAIERRLQVLERASDQQDEHDR